MNKESKNANSNKVNTLLATVPFDDLIKPFQPFMKRFGFGYIHFNNGTCLMSNDLNELIKNTWNKNQNEYDKNITKWCKRHCC